MHFVSTSVLLLRGFFPVVHEGAHQLLKVLKVSAVSVWDSKKCGMPWSSSSGIHIPVPLLQHPLLHREIRRERERRFTWWCRFFFFNFKRNMNYYLPLSHDLVSSACFLFPLLLSLEESQWRCALKCCGVLNRFLHVASGDIWKTSFCHRSAKPGRFAWQHLLYLVAVAE